MPISANGNDRSITRQRNESAPVVTCLSVNVSAYLIPGAAIPLVEAYMACLSASEGSSVPAVAVRTMSRDLDKRRATVLDFDFDQQVLL